MSKPPITELPTLAELSRNATKGALLPIEALAGLSAAVAYGTTIRAANGTAPASEREDTGCWVGVHEAAKAKGWPVRWFFAHAKMPFCKRLSKKVLLVDLDRLDRAIRAGDVKPYSPKETK